MKPSPVVPKLPDLPLRPVAEMGLKELERIRLILRGGSVIDWRRLHFKTWAEVDRFLRLCQYDPESAHDQRWMRLLLAEAVEYLRRTFEYRVSDAVANPKEIHDLFLYASGIKSGERYRRIACVVLKVLHVIQHIEGRDLLFRLPVAEQDLASLVMDRVSSVAEEMRQKGLRLVSFENSLKSRESVVTKLLQKKDTVAAQIYDRTRFRIVTETRADILPVLYFLTQRLFPFHVLVPGQTENTLLAFKEMLAEHPHFLRHADELHLHLDYEEDSEPPGGNAFSGSGYRALNFVVDLPIRMDPFLPPPEQDTRARPGRIVFQMVEFQLFDRQTAIANEQGENAHDKYKKRQQQKVLKRLSKGLVVPKKV